MKRYINGLVTGILIGAIVTAIPAIAENIDALFNEVRININGIDRVQWGESIEFDDGTQAPYSILYNGTTYLPLRKTAELLGKEVYWNGDSKTVSVVNKGSRTIFIAEKPDKNGNMWKYSNVEKTADGDYYLIAEDENRGFTRAYRMVGKSSLRITEDSIYFARKKLIENYGQSLADIIRLDFANDWDTQDGEIVNNLPPLADGDVVIDGEYVFYIQPRSRLDFIVACNYITGEQSDSMINASPYYVTNGLKLESNDENAIVFGFKVHGAYSDIKAEDHEITFDKTTNTFGDKRKPE